MRMPAIERRLGFGLGLDMPWGSRIGFTQDSAGRDAPTQRVQRFLGSETRNASHVFVSWQPRDRSELLAQNYFDAFDGFFDCVSDGVVRALHQTALNLGTLECPDRTALIRLTNVLTERYRLAWVNEDLGLWSLGGRPLPYPMPPFLTDQGLRAAIRNCVEVQRSLVAPLVIEFPGFSDEMSLSLGQWHAYDFFRRTVEESGTMATLDVGHLLSYQWSRGLRGVALYGDLERLPLSSCFEIHMSGCAISGERFLDLHHGVLLDEQLELLDRLIPLCKNLHAVTYEDPKFDAEGRLFRKALPNVDRMRERTSQWSA